MLDLGEVRVGDASHRATWRIDRSASSRRRRMISPTGFSDDSDGFMATIEESNGVMHLALAALAKLAIFG